MHCTLQAFFLQSVQSFTFSFSLHAYPYFSFLFFSILFLTPIWHFLTFHWLLHPSRMCHWLQGDSMPDLGLILTPSPAAPSLKESVRLAPVPAWRKVKSVVQSHAPRFPSTINTLSTYLPLYSSIFVIVFVTKWTGSLTKVVLLKYVLHVHFSSFSLTAVSKASFLSVWVEVAL